MHDVENQSTPWTDINVFRANRPLRDALQRHQLPGRSADLDALDALGAQAGSRSWQQQARLAHRHPPVLHTHDAVGRRVDEVEFHPAYHALMQAALAHGLHGTPWSRGPGSHLQRAAAFMLFAELDIAVLCPVTMTYAATPALRGNLALTAACAAGLADTRYDARALPLPAKQSLTMGMGMTERHGGSDLRANTTRAEADGDTAWGTLYRLTGHKWFFSAPQSDAHLVLAQAPQGPTCFCVPRLLPDGTRNAVRLMRLKDKLGNRANASAEVELDRAAGWLVGEPGRGIPQILTMGALTRLDCALGTAALMHQALSLAVHHARQRHAFGRRLADQPLMRSVLVDLALESEAATALALRTARAVERSEHGEAADSHEALMRRLLTPVAKFWICKRGSMFAQEAMECLGGNGYVEADGEGVMARIYREMPLNSIWEGAGNLMALDLLRVLRQAAVAQAVEHELLPARGAHPALDRAVQALLAQLQAPPGEAAARRLARDLAVAVQAALLLQQAPASVFERFCESRLAGGGNDVPGLLPAGADWAEIVDRSTPATPP